MCSWVYDTKQQKYCLEAVQNVLLIHTLACILKCMKYKKMKPQALLRLKDMQTALQYGSLKSDRRIQVVMPEEVVEQVLNSQSIDLR